MALGSKIKALLEQKNMTILELSKKTGISKNTLYAITKRDSDNIRYENLSKIANALDVTVYDLLDEGQSISEIDENGVITHISKMNNDAMKLKIIDLLTGSDVLRETFKDTLKKEQMDELNKRLNDKLQSDLFIQNKNIVYFDKTEYTDEELNSIRHYAEFIKSQRKDKRTDELSN